MIPVTPSDYIGIQAGIESEAIIGNLVIARSVG
jgi:hypothetical protein